jgi:hypothetical protein
MQRALIAAVLATGGLAAAAQPALAVDLSVSSVEVTQATQKPDNSIKIVARRSTAVRATIAVTGSAAAVPGVTGVVRVFRNGTEITPAGGVAPLAALTAPLAPNRQVETDTLNFELPVSALNQLTATTNLDVQVDVTPVPGETNAANNQGTANNLTVVAGVNPKLFFTRIDYTPSGLGLPSTAFIQPGTGDAFVKGILPVDDRDSGLYTQGLFPSLPFSRDDDGDNILTGGSGTPADAEGNALLNLLEQCRQLIVSNGLGATESTFLNGWIAGNPLSGNGLAGIGGRTSYVNTDLNRGQRSYAHELTHNLGFDHISNPIDQVGWDVGARLSGNPATNNTTGRVKPLSLFDIQVPGLLTNQAWIETPKYISLLGNTSLGFGSPDAAGGGDIKRTLRRRVLAIQGVLDPSGRKLLELEPVFRYPWLSQPTPAQTTGDYVAEVVTSTGGVIRAPFNGAVRDDGKAEQDPFGSFTVMVAAPANITSIRIRQRDSRKPMATVRRTKSPPRISITRPLGKASLGKRATVRWKASDGDTPRTDLRFQVAYSSNGGVSFVPVGVGIAGSGFRFDATQVRRTRGKGVIRVFVSDGLNTAYDDVKGLRNLVGR